MINTQTGEIVGTLETIPHAQIGAIKVFDAGDRLNYKLILNQQRFHIDNSSDDQALQ